MAVNPTHRKRSRIGMKGYADIIRCLIDEACTLHEVMERCGIVYTTAFNLLGPLHAMGVIHIDHWRYEFKQPYRAAYRFGPGADAPMPSLRPNGGPVRGVRQRRTPMRMPSELVAFVSLLRELETPVSARELSLATGVSLQGVRPLLRHMRSLRLVRIGQWCWRDHGGPPTAHYEFAPGQRDAPRPVAKASERYARYARKRAAWREHLGLLQATAGTVSSGGI